ncbi:MAG: hypothetical protein IPJ59_23445 [Nannocystis sp.]|nr:hypothetical protein [Nannocystis sp.]
MNIAYRHSQHVPTVMLSPRTIARPPVPGASPPCRDTLAGVRRVLVSLLCLAACTAPPSAVDTPSAPAKATPPAAPSIRPLDAHAAGELSQALDTVAPEYRSTIAARGLAELERGRLGDPLVDALDALAAADPVSRSQLIAQGLDSPDARAGWTQRCTTPFEATMNSLATIAPADRTRFLLDTCSAGLADLHRADAATAPDPMALLLALVTLGALERAGAVDPAERKAVTALFTPVPGDSPPP